MAVSLGKQNVYVEVYQDDRLHHSYTDRRVVYRKADGRFEVNWFGGGRREVIWRHDSHFYQIIHYQSISKYSL